MKRIFRGEDEARGRFLEEKRTQEDFLRTEEDARGSKRIEDFRGRKRTQEDARGF